MGYIPNADAAFDEWIANFLAYASPHAADLGVTPEDVAPVGSAKMAWDTVYAAHQVAQTNAIGKRQAKDAARATLEDAVRAGQPASGQPGCR